MRMTSLSATLSTLEPVTCTSITWVFGLHEGLHRACCFMRLHQMRPTDAWREHDVQPCTDAGLRLQRKFSNSQVIHLGVRSNGSIMSGMTCFSQGFHSPGGGSPKTAQTGGLPKKVCCNAPDLQIRKFVTTA
jgi:hypothetical protein